MAGPINIPQDLNWVEKRASCSAGSMFADLQAGIENDVATINRVTTSAPDNPYRFMTQLTSDGKTLVVGQAGGGPRVKLSAYQGRIWVQDEINQLKWSARVTFSNEGRCLLKRDDGSELEQWQFRKMALHDLFFEKEEE